MASEPLLDDFGDKIEVEADELMTTAPDGSISPSGAILVTFHDGKDWIRMRLSGERLDQFRELLDRAAMPGQVAAAVDPAEFGRLAREIPRLAAEAAGDDDE